MSDEKLELKPFQVTGAKFLATKRRACIYDDPGLGKTTQLIHATNWLEPKPRKILVLGSKSSLAVWMREYKKWAPDTPVKLITASNKNVGMRSSLWRNAYNAPGITLTNYDTWRIDFQKDEVPTEWDHITGDEAHQIQNRSTQRYKSLQLAASKTSSLFWATGSPMSRGPQNIFTHLQTIAPRVFTSFWKFVSTWCEVTRTPYGTEIGPPRNVENFKRMLSNYAIQRLKSEVAPEVPLGFKSILPVEFAEDLLGLYERLEVDAITELPNENLVVNTNTLVQLLHLRQFCITPKLLSEELPYGPALEKVGELLNECDDYHCVIFTPFAEALPIFKQFFVDVGVSPNSIFTLQGGTHPNEVAHKIEQFTKTRGIMLCTIAFAQSFEFLTPDKVFFIGFDWDPEKNKQAERRTERLITRHVVNYYYVVCVGSVDEHVLETCVMKNINVSTVIKTADDLRKIFYGQ